MRQLLRVVAVLLEVGAKIWRAGTIIRARKSRFERWSQVLRPEVKSTRRDRNSTSCAIDIISKAGPKPDTWGPNEAVRLSRIQGKHTDFRVMNRELKIRFGDGSQCRRDLKLRFESQNHNIWTGKSISERRSSKYRKSIGGPDVNVFSISHETVWSRIARFTLKRLMLAEYKRSYHGDRILFPLVKKKGANFSNSILN
jgi:hypothetical protein